MIKLYNYYRSTAAYRVRLALSIKELEYELIDVNLIKDGGEQHSAEFRELNPQGLVPVLIDDGIVITQSLSILQYLEETYHTATKLIPDAPDAKAYIRSLTQMIACDMHPLNNLRVLQYLKNELKVTEEQKLAWYHHWLKLGFDALEELLARDQDRVPHLCFGNRVSLADVCLIPQLYNAKRFDFDLSPYPNLRKVDEHCLELPEFQRAYPQEPQS